MKHKVILLFLLLLPCSIKAQYILNGSATQDASCNCYKLTDALNTQSGSMWNINQLNLNNSFDFKFDVYFGTNDANGADGIAFILQPVSTSLGSSGGGLGYQGITPSVGILMDTWQNTAVGDPVYDYISIQKNGNTNHTLMQDLAVPVQASATNINIEDGAYHVLRIQWDEPTKRLSVYFDGAIRQSIIIDMVATIFSGSPMVFWGFTAATGGANNLQKVCTLLNPNFSFNTGGTNFCFGTPIQFNESSDAFAPIVSWLWNFGDGTTFNGQNPPPKVYANFGDYTVTLTVSGIDGCVSAPFMQTVKIVDAPISAFIVQTTNCQGQAIQFTNATTNFNNGGTPTNWFWQFSDGTTSNLQNPIKTFNTTGSITVQLSANNNFGCNAQPASSTINILPKPTSLDFTPFLIGKQCEKDTNVYNGIALFNAPAPNTYMWNFSNGQTFTSNTSNIGNIYFAAAGSYTGTLIATNSYGCKDSITKPITINNKPTYNIQPLKTCINGSLTFIGNGAIAPPDLLTDLVYVWNYQNPAGTGIIGPILTQNPVVNYPQPGIFKYYLIISTATSCFVFDSSTVTVAPKPLAGATILQKDTLCSGGILKIVNASNVPFSTISNIDVFYNSASSPSTFTSYANPTNNQIFSNAINNFNSPITKTDKIKIITTENINDCKDTLEIPYTLHAVPNVPQPDTLFTCKTTAPIAITPPTINNIFTGNFTYTGLGIMGNNFSPALANVGINNVNLLYTTQAGCTTTAIKPIEVQTPITLNAGPNVGVLVGGNITFNAIATGSFVTGANYSWLPSSSLQNAAILKPICTPTQTQIYTITANTTGGCVSKDSLLVTLVYDIEIPNTFTPNNDGVNDTWEIKYLNTQPFATIQIFNRYGQQVYNGNATSAPFNGKFNNQHLPVGTYYYLIKSRRALPYKGYVTIIR